MDPWLTAAAGVAGVALGGVLQMVLATKARTAEARNRRADRLRELYVKQLEFLYGIPDAIWAAVIDSSEWIEYTERMQHLLVEWQARAKLDSTWRVDRAYDAVRSRFGDWTQTDREMSKADQSKAEPQGARAVTRASFAKVLRPAIDDLVAAMRSDLEDLEGVRTRSPRRRQRSR